MNSDGTAQTRLTDNVADDLGATWSPDGSRLAFCSDGSGNREIFVMDADGSNLTNLSDNPASDCDAKWVP